jgi:hypothetical protein
LIEKTTIRSPATAAGRRLKPFDVKDDLQTRLDGPVDQIQMVKKIIQMDDGLI